jgi:hypothetical protein
MSASLMILIPVILLGIVGMLCFAGCILPTEGLPNDGGEPPPPKPFTEYSGMTVLPTNSLMAYWPLNETKDTAAAVDRKSASNGKYIDAKNNMVPPQTVYDWPEYHVPNGANPDVLSAAGAGVLTPGQPGIVAGDAVPLPDGSAPACMVVDGAYVEVDVAFKDKFVPPASFTVEAWVRVDWKVGDPHAFRFVLDMRESTPATAGFGICAMAVDNQADVYQWRGILGDGSAAFQFADTTALKLTLRDPAASAGPVVYLALTYDSTAGKQTLTLYVDGGKQAEVPGIAYVPNATQPLWIGAGAPYVARRTQPTDPQNPTSPLFPFVGAIQDVAIYSEALDAGTILQHFNDGSGKPHPSP